MATPHPSLNGLRAFEVAARLGSITAAAAELGVSHGAVSHQIGLLETLFGVPLLRRLPHSVQPTEEGAHLASKLSQAFSIINSGVRLLQPAPLKLSCSSSIMMNWLIPRLGAFQELHPNVEVRLNVNYGVVDFVRDEISVAIRLDGMRPPQEAIVEPLIPEAIGPVCSPDYADRHAVIRLETLHQLKLLASSTRPNAWRDWAAAIEHPLQRFEPHETYEHFYLQIQAAACGLGVALTPRILVEDQIAAGRLVAPFGFVLGPNKLVLWIAPHLRARPDLRALVAWLKSTIRGSPYLGAEDNWKRKTIGEEKKNHGVI